MPRAGRKDKKDKASGSKKTSNHKADKGLCHGQDGHWRRNCPAYLVKRQKRDDAAATGINVIEINTFNASLTKLIGLGSWTLVVALTFVVTGRD